MPNADPGKPVPVSPLMRALARFGYGTRGGLYLAIGLLAIRGALAHHRPSASPRGAILVVGDEPLGKVFVATIVLGLAGYSLWQFTRAIADVDHVGRKWPGLCRRFGFLFSGLVYVSLVYVALRILVGWEHGDVSGNRSARDWTAYVMAYPFGRWAVLATGVGLIGFGLFAVGWQSFRGEFDQHLMIDALEGKLRRATLVISRIGLVGQGLVFVATGTFLALAAYQANAHAARGIGGALDSVRGQPHGRPVLVAMGVGLLAYGVYNFLLACFRPIRTA